MSQWLFNVYMDSVVRDVNASVPCTGQKPLRANGDKFESNQLLFADDKAVVIEYW